MTPELSCALALRVAGLGWHREAAEHVGLVG